jgi:hypothetical protein
MPSVEMLTASRRDLLAAEFGERRASLLDQADALVRLHRRHATTGLELSEDERELKDRRRSHCYALVALCRAEMAALKGESVTDRRARLRRTADRAEYTALAKDATRRGDHSAAATFAAWADVRGFELELARAD